MPVESKRRRRRRKASSLLIQIIKYNNERNNFCFVRNNTESERDGERERHKQSKANWIYLELFSHVMEEEKK